MSGYQSDFSMSNRAVDAYDSGLVPASKVGGVPASLVEAHCRYAEWHHCSSRYNKVKFYNPQYVRATFGIEQHEDYSAAPQAVAALAAYKAAKKSAPVIHTNCRVEWLEWSGSIKHPRANECSADGCTVMVKGQTATVTLPNGNSFIKRLSTNGFSFRSVSV